MAETIRKNFTATPLWQDVTTNADFAAVAGAAVFAQCVRGSDVRIVFGGATMPAPDDGQTMPPNFGFSGTADNIWIKSATESNGEVAFMLEDEA